MAAIDIVNRALREFRRYTGDGLAGEPFNAPLPVGDPSSGVHNPKKADLRAALLAPIELATEELEAIKDAAVAETSAQADRAETAANGAETQADRADTEADRAQGYAQSLNLPAIQAGDVGKQLFVNDNANGYDLRQPVIANGDFKTVALLLADTTLAYAAALDKRVVAVGDIVGARGFRYQVAASGASDHHVITAGGVKLYVLPTAGGKYNLSAFGNVGTGTSNDTPILQKVYDILAVAGGGLIIEGYGRVYRLNTQATLTLAGDFDVTIEGVGGPVLRPQVLMNSLHLRGYASGTLSRGGVAITGVYIDGADAGTNYDGIDSGRAIRTDLVARVLIERNLAKNVYGGGIQTDRGTQNVAIRDNVLLNCWGLNPNADAGGAVDQYGDGVYVARSTNIAVVHNFIWNDADAVGYLGRGGVITEFSTELTLISHNVIHGYDRNIHTEASNGRHRIAYNRCTGSSMGLLLAETTGYTTVEGNYFSNEGVTAGKVTVISPRNQIYLYLNQPGLVFRRNHVKQVAGGMLSAASISCNADGAVIDDNIFENTDAANKPNVYLFGRVGVRFRRNRVLKAGTLTLSNAQGYLVEENYLDVATVTNENVAAPGNTIKGNTFLNSDGLIAGAIAGYNCYSALIDNVVTNLATCFIFNDDTVGGEISGNTIRRTVAGAVAQDKFFVYPPLNRRSYHCRRVNTFVDTVAPATTIIRPYGEVFSENGRLVVFGAAAPTTGAWNVGDIAYLVASVSGGPLGFVCTTAGSPGTWTPFGHSVLEGSVTFDPPSISTGARTSTTVTVNGAALGDFAEVSFSLSLGTLTVTAFVSAANTVTVVFANLTGSAVDLGSGTLRARVRKQS